MKRLSTALTACIILLSSCQKEELAEIKKTTVTVDVTGFELGVKPFYKTSGATAEAGDTLKNYINRLDHLIYNSSGVLVKQAWQHSLLPEFGKFVYQLEPGTYTVVVLGGHFSGWSIRQADLLSTANTAGYVNDTFYKKLSITVGDRPSSHILRMDRLVGAIDITMNGTIPAQASMIVVGVQNEMNQFRIDSETRQTPFTREAYFSVTDSDRSASSKNVLIHVLNTDSPVNVLIRCYDAQNVLLAERTINNVRCYQNEKTLLTGTLFNP